MKRTAALIPILALLPLISIGQQLGAYNLAFLPQRTYLNPAFAPHSTFHAGIPLISGFGYSYCNTGFTYAEMFRPAGDDSLELDVDGIIKGLHARNLVAVEAEIDLLSLGFKAGKSYFSFHATEHSDVRLTYSKSAVQFLVEGNASTVGTVQHLNPGVEATHYREYTLDWSAQVINWLRAGIGIKYLYGMEHVLSRGSGINVHTNPVDYSLTATSDYSVYTSGLDTASFSDFGISQYAFGKDNTGYAADLGITIKASPRLEVSASVLDLGHITWKSENAVYHTSSDGKPFYYSGIDLDAFAGNDSTSAEGYLSAVGDSLYESLDIKTTHEHYSYAMPVKLIGSATWYFTPRYQLSTLVRHRTYETGGQTDYQFSFIGKLRTWLNYYLSATKTSHNPFNMGAGASMNFHNDQVYFVSDNVPGLFCWKKSHVSGFRAGINIMFGTRLKYMPPPQPVLAEPVVEHSEPASDPD